MAAFAVPLLHPLAFLLCLFPVFGGVALQRAVGPICDLLDAAAEADHLLLGRKLE